LDECLQKVTELEIRRLVLGLSRSEMAVQLELCCEEGGGISSRTIRRWEARMNKPFPLFRKALCTYFKIDSVGQLGIGDTLEAARWWTYMTPDEWIEEVNRRKALEVLGATGLLLPVSPLTAVAQLLEGRASIGAGDLAFAAQAATDIASAYLETPNAEMIRTAKAHAYTLLDLLARAQMSPDTRTRLAAVASDAVCLAGYADLNAGRLDQADAWFTDALKLARQAGDRRLEALALASRAWPLLDAPDPDQAAVVEALKAAAGSHSFLPPAARAYVFAYLAREYAALGEDLVSGRFLEHARDAVALIPYQGPGWGWWSTQGELSGWDGVRPQAFTGSRSLRLGRSAEALQLYSDALDYITLPARRSALHGHLMRACVGLGDPDRACASAHAALDEAKAHELGINLPKIRKVRRSFPKPWAALKVVVELDERLAFSR
jgi:tetratricopeptide (TPR) repeat protein